MPVRRHLLRAHMRPPNSRHPLVRLRLQMEAGESREGASPKPPTRKLTAADWAERQHEFKDLAPLPTGWIRVRSNSTGEIYYYCMDTGETTFEMPSGLPTGWTEMKSRSTGQTYYWHAATGVSQFKRPTSSDAS